MEKINRVIRLVYFYGFGLGLYGKLERYQVYEVMLGIWLFQVIFSNIWLHYFYFGPWNGCGGA